MNNPDGMTHKLALGTRYFRFNGAGLNLGHGSTAQYHLALGGRTVAAVMTITK